MPADQLVIAAEAITGTLVESRLWACAVLRAHYGLPVESPALAEAVGAEAVWQSPEHRVLVREWARHGLARSGGLCRRGWGSTSKPRCV
jgi:hypothetical protein